MTRCSAKCYRQRRRPGRICLSQLQNLFFLVSVGKMEASLSLFILCSWLEKATVFCCLHCTAWETVGRWLVCIVNQLCTETSLSSAFLNRCLILSLSAMGFFVCHEVVVPLFFHCLFMLLFKRVKYGRKYLKIPKIL